MNDVPQPVLEETPTPRVLMEETTWSWPRRLGFRFNFSYWALFALTNTNLTLFIAIPIVGRSIQQALAVPGGKLAEWVGAHAFHLNGVAARWHASGSGDTALHYVLLLCSVVIAAIAAVVWTAL